MHQTLNNKEHIEAHHLLKSAQGSIGDAISALRSYYDITGDDRVFQIVHTLESRHSDRPDTLGGAFNLDDCMKRLAAVRKVPHA